MHTKHLNFLKISFKFFLLTTLFFLLISSNRLDMAKVKIFLTRYDLLLLNIIVWFLASLVLNSTRWHFLLKGVGVCLPPIRLLSVVLIGLMFSILIPGAVSGDVVKTFYVLKEKGSKLKKLPVILSVFFDRLLGFYSILFLAMLMIMFNVHLFTNPYYYFLLIFISLSFFFLSFVFLFFLFPWKKDFILGFLSTKKIIGFSFLLKIYQVIQIYKKVPTYLTKAFLCALSSQGLFLFYFFFITKIIVQNFNDWQAVMLIYPLGTIATALPLAPGGAGVGHFSYDLLFKMIGVNEGANIFNIFFIGQVVLGFLGVIPYFFLKNKFKSKEKNISTSFV